MPAILARRTGDRSFSGTLAIDADRLDTLATLWRKPAADNPLFNMPGSFQSKVSLLGPNMALTDGRLTLDGTAHSLTALINFGGADRRIDLSGQFTRFERAGQRGTAGSDARSAAGPERCGDLSARGGIACG